MTSSADDITIRPPRPLEFVSLEPRRCRSWFPGHGVHWVQGMRANRADSPGSFVPCLITEVAIDGWFTLVLTGTEVANRYWTHDIEKLRVLLGEDHVEINEHWSVVHQRRSDGGATNYISVTQNPRPCVFEDPSEEPHEQLQTHGGFSISGAEVLRILRERAEAADDESSAPASRSD